MILLTRSGETSAYQIPSGQTKRIVPSFAHPEAIRFAAQNNPLRTFRVFEIQCSNNVFQFSPGLSSDCWIAALGFGGGCAEQQVMADQSRIHAAIAVNGTRVVPRFTCSRTAMRAH